MTTQRLFLLVLIMIFICPVTDAQDKEKEVDRKLILTPYGFLKGDMFYSTAEVMSFADSSLAAPQRVTGIDQSAIGFTAQHTRLGLRGSIGDKIKAGGLIEVDFFTNSFDANGRPRIRLGYASVAKGGFEARFGQQWDLFSPHNPNTNNTNGNMWFAGNRGFRRAQVQISYKLKNDFISPMLQLSAGETTREEKGLGMDNRSGVPMFQGRLSGTILSTYVLGISFVYGTYLEKLNIAVGPDLYKKDFNVNTSGISVDLNLPIHKYFSLLGEFNTGTNLNNANLFSISGNYSWLFKDGVIHRTDRNSLGFWVNATSRITSWLHLVAGYGMDINTAETFKVNDIEKNSVLYGNVTFPIKHGFSVAVEFQNITTTKVTGVDAGNKIKTSWDHKANVISLSGRITF